MLDESTHRVGFLKVPANLEELPSFQAVEGFVAPRTVYNMGLCTVTEDQGSNPWCAAYSTTSFAEAQVWKMTDKPVQFDPAAVYKRAKEIDGDPHGDGTSLDAAMKAFMDVYPNVFDREYCKIKIIRSWFGNFEDLKYALHKYGSVVGGFNVTDEWYNADKNSNGFIPSGGKPIGGHAVHIVGYNDKGLMIQNSWGEKWGEDGFALLRWADAKDQFMYGCVLRGCLKNLF